MNAKESKTSGLTHAKQVLVPVSLDLIDDQIRHASESGRLQTVAAMNQFRRRLRTAAHQQRVLSRNVLATIPAVGLVDALAFERFRRGDEDAPPQLAGLLIDAVPARVFAFIHDEGRLVIQASAPSLAEARHQLARLGDIPTAIQYILVPDTTLERDFTAVCEFVDVGDGHAQLLCERTGDVSGHFRTAAPTMDFGLSRSASPPLPLLRSVSLDDVDDVIARAITLGSRHLERAAVRLRAAMLDERLALRPEAGAVGVVDEAHFHRVVYGDLAAEIPLLGLLVATMPSKVVAFSWLHDRPVVEAVAVSAADAEILAARRFADAERNVPPEDDSPVDALHYLRVPVGMQERHFDAYCERSISREGAVVVRSLHTGDFAQLTRGAHEEGTHES